MSGNQNAMSGNQNAMSGNQNAMSGNQNAMSGNANEMPGETVNEMPGETVNEMPGETVNEITYKKEDDAREHVNEESVTIYWKYENPSDKDYSFTKKNFLDPLVRELDAKKATNDISNPYVISDEMYNKNKNKIDKENEKNDKEEQKRNDERIMNSGEEYAVVLNKLWNNIINEDTKIEKNSLPTKQKFLNFEIFFNYLKERRPGFEERLGVNRSYKYYYVSKREKIDNKIQKCNPSDFLINDPNFLENWKLVKKQIRQYQQLGCRSRFEGVDGNKCILDNLISLVRDIEKESEECFGGFLERGLKSGLKSLTNKFKSNPQAETQEEKKTSFLGNLFKGGRTKKRNSNRKKTKRAKRSKKSKK